MSTPNSDQITIVDASDQVIGAEDRSIVRTRGLIHRIVKVIVRNSAGQILIQRRAANLEDSPLKWDLSATGHVDAGEDYLTAALRETQEEIGLSGLNLAYIGKYYYERPKHELTIRRFNAIFVGHTDKKPVFDSAEVAEIKWVSPPELAKLLKTQPHEFTRSFIEIFDQFGDQVLGHKPVDHSASN